MVTELRFEVAGALEVIQAMHDIMRQTLPLDDFPICPHDDRDGCHCRNRRRD